MPSESGGVRRLRRRARAIAAFWTWWSAEGAAATAAGTDGTAARTTRLLRRVDPALGWRVEPGVTAPRRLVLVGARTDLRPVTERWRLAAPPVAGWEVASAPGRVPLTGPDAQRALTVGGVELALDAARFTLEPGAGRHALGVHHPGFGQLAGARRREAAVRLAELVLGADVVVRRIRTLRETQTVPAGAVTAEALRAEVDAQDGDGDQWLALRSTLADGTPIVTRTRALLHPLDHPPFDLHSEVTISGETRPEGPTDAETRQLLHALQQAMGPAGLVVAQETLGGARHIHVYSDSLDAHPREGLDRFARRRRHVRVRHLPDPEWEAVAHIRAYLDRHPDGG